MKSSKMVFAGGAVLAVLGMLLSYLYTAGARRSVQEQEAVRAADVEAYVATAEIPLGSTWEQASTLLAKRSVPAAVRPDRAIANPEQIAGKTAVRNIARGEVITTEQFNAHGAESLQIPEGHSALTLSLPAPQGVADYIQPGARANVFATFKGVPGPNGEQNVITRLLLSDVSVIANRRALPAQALAAGAPPPSGGDEILLTLAVTIEQAERIIFAKENGAVWFTLMRPGDPAGVGIGQTYTTVFV